MRDDALPTKAQRWVVDTRTRGLDDRLVSCAGLDRLPVGQAPGVLEKTLLASSVNETSRAFFRRPFLVGPSIETCTSGTIFSPLSARAKKPDLVAQRGNSPVGKGEDPCQLCISLWAGG